MDYPKLLRESERLKERLLQINDPHMVPLTRFVHCLRENMKGDVVIPYFDPWDGGIDAEVMFLLEAPGPKARNSGFVSMNNPDETAKIFFELLHEARIDRKQIVTWNTVPWYIGSSRRIRPAGSSDIADGVRSLSGLIDLLPRLSAIVLVGKKAQKVEGYIRDEAPQLEIFRSPHPSPMYINRKPENRGLLLSSLKAVKAFLDV